MSSKQKRILSLFGRYNTIYDTVYNTQAAPMKKKKRRRRRGKNRAAHPRASPVPVVLPEPEADDEPSWPSIFGRLKQGEHFSIFKEDHQDECAAVYDYLLSHDSFDKFEKESARLTRLLNEGLYLHAVSIAMIHRKDVTDGELLPPRWQINPTSFFPRQAIDKARNPNRAILQKKTAERKKGNTEIDGPPAEQKEEVVIHAKHFDTGTDRDPEFQVAWFREDYDLNNHHLHWHLAYPGSSKEIPIADRQGELFYYMHHQMLARYDAERIAVELGRVEPYADWDDPIPEGYNSHLTDHYGANPYAPRPSGMTLADLTHDSSTTLIDDQKKYYRRLLEAIEKGTFIMAKKSSKDPDVEVDVNIDNLGAAVESSDGSPNKGLYGSVHNMGHNLLAGITDPDGRYKQAPGVMADTVTAVRDPIFFRWHKHIDNIFFKYKSKLGPYGAEDLTFDGITVESIKVRPTPPGEHFETDVLTTRMENTEKDIQHNMFLGEDVTHISETQKVTVNQLNHDEFEYEIGITAKQPVEAAAIRIFMAPSLEKANKQFTLEGQRRLLIEMDKFVIKLKQGANTIKRSSKLSSVIKRPDPTIKQLNANGEGKGKCSSCKQERYCECGWPLHLLLPRGTQNGMTFDLFCMVTDWSSDKTDDKTDLDEGTSYCGVKDKNRKYPDSRAMGFPFDRKNPSI